jgi:hypothetical protein
MFEPFADTPDKGTVSLLDGSLMHGKPDLHADTSLMLVTEEELGAWTLGADKYVRFHTCMQCVSFLVLMTIVGGRAGLHLSIHAIGDKANHLLLDAYERLIQVNGKQDRRLRIEHAQHLRYIHIHGHRPLSSAHHIGTKR